MKRKWMYSLDSIASATHQSVHTVRRDRRNGRINPDDLVSVSKYIAASFLQNGHLTRKTK